MPDPIYVPILKGKEGEYAALEMLANDIKSHLLPLIEIPEIPYDYANDGPAKTIDEYVSSIPQRLQRAWGTAPFFLDITWLGEDAALSNGQSVLLDLTTRLSALNARPIPVLYRSTSQRSVEAANRYGEESGEGICVRLLVSDFEDDVDLESEIARLLPGGNGLQGAVDLILDLEDLGATAGTANLVARSIFSMIPFGGNSWRRIILAGASFPEDLSDVSAATIVNRPRLEWDLWKALQKKPSALPRRDLIFADYAMAHPVGKTLDPRTMRMSANIRYTTEEEWLILKGRNVRQYGFDQYFELCRTLVAMPEYSGRSYSWGDGYIADCADATQGPGNATTWRKVGVNHHITLVMRGIANLRNVV